MGRNEIILKDYYRISGKKKGLYKEIRHNKVLKQLYYLRKYQQKHRKVRTLYYRLRLYFAQKGTTVEIPKTVKLGEGALFVHPCAITINSQATIGKNLTMLKGATIGHITEGKRSGAPIVGDDVYIGLNATVVGGIKIGNDVCIAPNSFVNFDVPSHSIVLGNPGVVHSKENATEGYIKNRIQ